MKNSPVLLLPLCFLMGIITSWGQGIVSSVEVNRQPKNQPPSFAQLTTHFHQFVDDSLLAGTVMVLKKGNQIYMDKYGMQNIEAGLPMEYSTIFRMASMTKPVTSVAAMMLVEEGKLQLDDPVEKYLPAFADMQVLNADGVKEKLKRSISVRDLFRHTSGIATTIFQNTPVEKAYVETFKNEKPTSLEGLVNTLASLPLAHQPGEHWTYGYSTDVLARVVEVVSGEPVDAFFEKRIFQPLKMEDTGFRIPIDKLARLAAGYNRELKLLSVPDENSPYVTGEYYPRGASGLVSTAIDYMHFAQMLLNGGELDGVRLLTSESVQQMTQNQLPDGVLPYMPDMPIICNGFGLGFGVQTEEVVLGSTGDFGWPGAYFTYFFVDPNHNGIATLLVQSADFANIKLMSEFHQMASRIFAEENTLKRKNQDR